MNRSWLLLTLVIISTLAVACAPLDNLRPGHNTAADPAQIYGASLQDWARPQLETLGPLPHYTIHAQLAPAGDRLEGQMTVVVPNAGPTPWPDLVFRLYPNTPQYGAAMDVAQVHINGDPVIPESVSEGTALRLPLTAPLAPGEEVNVDFVFGVDLPARHRLHALWLGGRHSQPARFLPDPGCARRRTLNQPGFTPIRRRAVQSGRTIRSRI